MAKLNKDQQIFIVQSLACFEPLRVIKELFKEKFGFDITIQQIEFYDPTKIASANLGRKWREAFKDAREKFQNEVIDIPIANKAFRLKKMQDTMDKAESMKNYPLVLQTLEQAAKECGDAYTNKSKVDHTTNGESIVKPSVIQLVAPNDNGTD